MIQIQGAKGARPIRVDESIPVGNWTSLAKELEGFSGRQINKLCNAWQVGNDINFMANRRADH